MKNRRSIIALLLVAIIGIVGLTAAYFSNSTSITNEFETSEYGTDVIETFTSPTGWQPGDETPKVLTVKNTGEVDEAVRIKVEENYYYYYYNYKLAPDEETSELLDKVTFNPLINASTTCTDSIGTNGETIRSCTSDGSGYDGATYTLKFIIETVQYNKYASAWNTEFAIAEEKPHPATQFLTENATNPSTITSYNDASADKGKMFYFTHTLNEGTENEKIVTETRYIGDEPKNYVYFNCADPAENEEYNYATSCEVWRILGVFDVEKEIDDEDNPGEKKTITEQRMKLIKGSSLRKDNWNPSMHSNDWTTSNLKTYLNTDYYNGLKLSAKEMIDEAKYYLGAVSYVSTEQLYTAERGTIRCGACGTNDSKLTWQGNVGLMYPSDEYMVFGNDVNVYCYTNPYNCSGTNAKTSWVYNWLYNNNDIGGIWFLSSKDGESYFSLAMNASGTLDKCSIGAYGCQIYVSPVVYLSADVQIFDGDGSSENPYKLKK